MPMSRLSWLLRPPTTLTCPRACTNPPVPLSVPMRADDSGSVTFDWKFSVAPVLIVTGSRATPSARLRVVIKAERPRVDR